MTVTFPSRPFTRTFGSLDNFNVVGSKPHLNDEAAPGCRARIEGWIADTAGERVTAAWLDLGGEAILLQLDQNRPDAARSIDARDRNGIAFGFRQIVDIPQNLVSGIIDARVVGRAASGGGLYGSSGRRVRVAHPIRQPRRIDRSAGREPDISFRVRDTQSAPYTFGRGAHTIREEASLRISGTFAESTPLQITATPPTGETVTWHVDTDAIGRFDAALWTGDMIRGIYDLNIAYVIDEHSAYALAHCAIAIAGPHYLPPLHLSALMSKADAGLTHFEPAGVEAASADRTGFIAGQPIAIAGWCIEPLTRRAPLAAFVALNEMRPVPISHGLPDPRGNAGSDLACGFGGIIDTTRLPAGNHRLRVYALAHNGGGWFVVDDRTLILIEHRAALFPNAPEDRHSSQVD